MEISQFYDVNKRTQTEQVLKNQEDIKDLQSADGTLQENIDKEIQDRTDADASLAYDIGELQSQIDGLGNVFTLKGSVATYGDLPATDNHIGDVWYVEADAVGYVWIDDNGTERWEQLGLPIDLSDYVTTSDLALALEDYQEKLTAGAGISIIDNTISATSSTKYYAHCISISTPTSNYSGRMCFVLISTQAVEYTKQTLGEYLYNKGIKYDIAVGDYNYFPVQSTYFKRNENGTNYYYSFIGIYGQIQNNIYTLGFIYEQGTAGITTGTSSSTMSSGTLTDIVFEI